MFTIPYSAFQVGIYGKKGLAVKEWADLKDKKVGVIRGSSLEIEFTKRQKELNLNILYFEDDSTTMQALFSDQVDAVAEPDAQANAAIRARNATDSEVKFFFGIQPNSIATRKDAWELHQWLNNTIYFMKNQGELDAIARQSRRLARRLFLAMALNGPKLEKRQVVLGHFVDIGAELFVWGCTLAHAQSRVNDSSLADEEIDKLVRLVRFFGKMARERISSSYRHLSENMDAESWRIAQEV